MSDEAQRADAQGPHPLAVRLADRLASERPGARVLVLGAGNGRNLPVLFDAGLDVETVDANADLAALCGPYDAVLSTHALLHGTRESVARRLGAIATLVAPSGLLYATLGSTTDPRCGSGTAVDGDGWAPPDGPEAGVAHAYFDRETLDAALADFAIVCAEDVDVRETVGRWAHDPATTPPTIHWFVVARNDRAAAAPRP